MLVTATDESAQESQADVLEEKAASFQYEAEDRSSSQTCSQSASWSGFTGRGYMDFGGNGTWIEWNNISAQSAGQYTLAFRYANGSTAGRQAAISVNGTSVASVPFAPTSAWAKWSNASVNVTLRQGSNVVRVAANTQNGGPNLDNLVVSPVDACPNDPAKTQPGACGCGVPEGSCGGTSTCSLGNEGSTVSMSCTSGNTIQSITFASYGTPNGTCAGGFTTSTCHAATSLQRVQAACVGKQSCTVAASNGVFGDPCAGTPKRLAVKYACGGTSTGGATGIHSSSTANLPGGEPTACEWEWTVRTTHYHPSAVVPRRMYFAACGTKTDRPTLFTSLAVGSNAPHPQPDPTRGGILVSQFDPATGTMVPGKVVQFPECRSMHGIAVSEDCSTVAALCRVPSGTTGYDADALATHPAHDWMTQPYVCGGKRNDEMWLYEWSGGDVTTRPSKYVVHRAIGSWEYGNDYLLYGEEDKTYAIALKTTVGGSKGDGNCHEADALLILDRISHRFTNRGWSWACGTGHTTMNRPAYQPSTKRYAMMCSTDYNNASKGGLGAFVFRTEDGQAQEFHYLTLDGIKNKGGASALLPAPDGGYVGVLVGVEGQTEPQGYPELPPTAIGWARWDASGKQVGSIRWVVKDPGAYLSYSNLVQLSPGRYLLGYGVMKHVGRNEDDNTLRVPWEYWVVEVDASGNRLTQPQRLQGAGWGEVDQMVSLGRGRAAWAYIENPAMQSNYQIPGCNQRRLQWTTYVSPNH